MLPFSPYQSSVGMILFPDPVKHRVCEWCYTQNFPFLTQTALKKMMEDETEEKEATQWETAAESTGQEIEMTETDRRPPRSDLCSPAQIQQREDWAASKISGGREGGMDGGRREGGRGFELSTRDDALKGHLEICCQRNHQADNLS